MATDIIKTIGATSSPTTPDYTSLQAWEDALPANLVTADERHIGECLNQGEFSGSSTLLTIGGQTTDATRSIILRCASGASFRDHADVRTNALNYDAAKGVAARKTGNYYGVVVITTQNVLLQDLQLKSADNNGAYTVFGNQPITIDSCIMHGGTSGGAFWGQGTGNVLKNCLCLASSSAMENVYSTNVLEAYGCTVVKLGSAGGIAFRVNYGTYTIKNCAYFNHTTALQVNVATNSGSSHNATDLATAIGSNNQTSLTFADQFENSTNDFRAKSTGALQAGTPDATNTPDDITGLTRNATTPWIGCWEVTGAAAASQVFNPLPQAMRPMLTM